MVSVSVILPNYNHAGYLVDRIDSILGQTFNDFELIILDDHSTDNSREIIERYRSHSKVSHIVYNSENSGSPFIQWARGIALSDGKYIWIAESDDSCEVNFLEKTIRQLSENPTAGIAYARSVEIEVESGKKFPSFQDHPRFSSQFDHSYFNKGKKEIGEKLIYENTIPNASGVVFRKDIYIETGGVDGSMKLCGDWLLWIKMLMISDVCFISDQLNYFRLTSASARSKFSKLDTLRERLVIADYIKKHHIRGAGKAEIRLLEMVFNNYKLNEFAKPLGKVMHEKKLIQHPRLKIVYAMALSVYDRIRRKFHPSSGLLQG